MRSFKRHMAIHSASLTSLFFPGHNKVKSCGRYIDSYKNCGTAKRGYNYTCLTFIIILSIHIKCVCKY